MIRVGIVIFALLLVAVAYLFIRQMAKNGEQVQSTQQSNAVDRFGNLNIPLSELSNASEIIVDSSKTLSINGQLKVNNSLVITPTARPDNAVAGQMYYDQSSNQLSYYNGSDFVDVGNKQTVNTIGGASGSFTLGDGLTQTGTQISNGGVLTVQGQAGNVTLTAGAGITISGTTISSTGISSFAGSTGDITIGNGLTFSGNQLSNGGVVSVASGSPDLTVTNDGAGNITLTTSGAGTGTVQSPGGTAGKIAKFTGVQTIADSLLSESGTTVTVSGDLAVTGSLALGSPLAISSGGTGATTASIARTNLGAATSGANNDITSLTGLTTALSVSQGGTGVGTLATNGVLLGNGTSAISSLVAGGSGLCLLSTSGAPAWQVCPSSAIGVATLDGLTGNLIIANSSGSGSTITIDDASTTQKGIVEFNGTNFSVSGGIANTIQNINTSATPTFAGINTNSITPSAALTVGATTQNLTLQGATTTITSTNGGSTASLTFVAPTANVVYRLQTAAAGTYDVCTTAGNCTGVGGGVSTPGGTTNALAKFTGSQTIGDSIISDDGVTVTVSGALHVTGTVTLDTPLAITSGGTGAATASGARSNLGAAASGANSDITSINGLTTALSVLQGGTGATSFTANGVLLGNGTGAVTSVAAGGSGLCLLSTAGAPAWSACPGSGGVTSVDGLAGALTIANSSGSGATITINDASTLAKGIAQFNSTNFSASSGVINTIQSIAVSATPTFAGVNTNSINPSAALTVGATAQNLTLQGATTTITSTNGANLASLTFVAPTANVTYRLQTAAAGTYDVCTTAGNCTGVGGSVTTPGGTTNALAKFTGSQSIGDSIISDNGTTVTVTGALHVTGTVTLDTPLAVTSGGTGAITPSAARTNLGAAASGANSDITSISGLTTALSVVQGGTGATSLTANGVLLGNGTSAISSLAAGSANQCLVSTAGAPIWTTCPGSGGVTSVNSQTGVVTIANASGSGGTVTINDASTSAKGIAQFNSTNFSASSGVINTIQNINTSAAPTFGQLTLSSSQASAAMLTVNNTNASGTGNLLDLQLNGSSKLAVGPSGAMLIASTINGQTISGTANFTGTLAVASTASLNGGATVTGTLTANTITPSSSLTVGATSQSFLLQGNASSTITATNGANTSTIAFQSPTASVTYRFLTATAGTYDICTTAGNCAGTGGGVTTPGGTTNAIAKFTGSQTLGDSIITDNGSTVTIGGTLAVNTITPSAAMTIGSTAQNLTLQGASVSMTATSGGITNSLTFATPSASNKTITIPNASGTLAVSASGPLALDANGNLTCPTCVTSGGGGGGASAVDSLNGLQGTLTLANATGSGSTITINDASTSQKGIAQFNSTNFTASSGVINTVQNINTAAAPTFGQLTLTSSQASATMLAVNNTNVSTTGNLLDLQLNGTSKFSVGPNGNTIIAGTLTSGTINGQTISSTANFTGSVSVATTLSVNTITPTSTLTIGATGQDLTLQGAGGTKLTATSGGVTNSLVFATPATSNKTITVPNATGTVAVSASGAVSLDSLGNITCPTCVTGSAVTSLNSLTGALTLANASAAGSTVTINDASTSAKGIAQFNSTNFSVSSGTVNTIQNINTSAAPTFGQLTLSSSQASAAMLTVNNTNVSATGNLVDLQLNGTSKFAVSPAGALTLSGNVNGQTISSSANFTGSLTVGTTLNANTITPSSSLVVGATTQMFTLQGAATSTITATSGANTTTLAFQAPTANVTYRFLTAAAGTYDVCTTVGNCAGVGGGVTTAGGTTNKLAKFTGSQAIGDSIITDNGTTVTIGGTLSVNTLTPSAALTVGATGQNLTLQGATVNLTATSGGVTNALTFATPSGGAKTVTIPNASGTVAVSASGAIALDAAGNITCPTCVTGTAVSSLNGLTGALTVANASAAGSTITLNDASTSAKGIAQFNSTNFSVSSGTVNTIQNINTTATPTFGQLTLTSSQASAAMLTVNNTNVSATGNLIDLQLNGSSRFAVSPAGALTLNSTVNGQTISSTANFTGTVTVGTSVNTNVITPSGAMTIGSTGQSFTLQGNASSTITATGGSFTTTVGFSGTPVGAVVYNFDRTVAAGTYSICSTAGNCAGIGGGVTTVGGTTNKLAKFTGSQTVGDSIITDNGTTVTVGGTLIVNVIQPNASPLTVGVTNQDLTLQGAVTRLTATTSGVTNTLTFATPTTTAKTITIPDATGTVCLQNSTSCGFALTSGSTAYIQNQSASAQSGNYFIQSASASAIGGIVRGANSQSAAIFEVQNSAGTALLSVAGATNFTTLNDNLIINGQGNNASTPLTVLANSNQSGTDLIADFQRNTGATVARFTYDAGLYLGNGGSSIAGYVAIGNTGGKYATINSSPLTANRTISLPDEAGTICIQSSTNCGFAAASGSANYIQNQNAGAQTSSNFWITGSGRANTSLLAPAIDVGSAATLNIGTTNATSIIMGKTASNIQTTVNGTAVFRTTAADSTTAFQVQNTGGGYVFNVDTTTFSPSVDLVTLSVDLYSGFSSAIDNYQAGGSVGLGVANANTIDIGHSGATTAIVGSLTQQTGTFSLSGNGASSVATTSGALTLQSVNSNNSIVITGASNTIALGTGSAGTITVGSSNTTTVNVGSQTDQARTINIGYPSATTAQTINIGTSASTGATTIKAGSGNLFLTTGGNTQIKTTNDSASAFQIQNANGTSLLTVDTSNSNITLLGNNSSILTTWTTTTAMSVGTNTTRVRGGAVTYNGYIYHLGGVDGTGATIATTQYAKINTDGTIGTWASTTSLPTALRQFQPVVANGYIYVIGGRDNSNATVATSYYAKLNTDGTIGTWNTTTALTSGTVARFAQGTIAYNGYIYVLGGYNSSVTAQSSVYYNKINADGTLDTTWTSTSAFSTGLAAINGTTVANGYAYVSGGFDGTSSYDTIRRAKINADGTMGSWTNQSGVIPGGGDENFQNFVANGFLYVVGGDNGSRVTSFPLNADGSVGSSTSLTTLPQGNMGEAAGASANGYFYLLGGSSAVDGGGTVRNTVYYASTSRLKVGGNVDLVGITGENLSEGGTGGALTAGNTTIVGTLQVQDSAAFIRGVSIGGTLSVGGVTTIKPTAASTGAFQVQNTTGVNQLSVDTTNARVYVGPTAGDTTGTLLVLGNKTNAGDPTGVAGAMYYSQSYNAMRCYQDGSWSNCSDPTRMTHGYNIQEEFLGATNGSYAIDCGSTDNFSAEYAWDCYDGGGGFGSSVVTGSDTYQHPGQIKLSTGASAAAGDASIYLSGGTTAPAFMIGGGETFETSIYIPTLSTATQEYIIRVGLCSDNDLDSPTCGNGVYFEYNRTNSTSWRGRTVQNYGTATQTSTTKAVTAGGWTTLKWVATSANSVTFYVKNPGETTYTSLGAVGSASTVPNAAAYATSLMFYIDKNVGGTTASFNVDYVDYFNDFTSNR